MSLFTCSNHDDGDRRDSVRGLSPIDAAETWVLFSVSYGADFGDSVDVLVIDQAERAYVVTVVFVAHPREWAESIGEPGLWRVASWRSTL